MNNNKSTKMKFLVPLVLGALATPATAVAATSEWAETEGGRIRLTALPPTEDGIIHAVLDVDLLPGWKTYWRDPGETGIPPQVDFEGSMNVDGAQMGYPPPERIDDGYSIWAGYTYPVIFPITIRQREAGKQSIVDANIFMGICEKICIPVQAELTVTVGPDEPATDYERHVVDTAFRELPGKPDDAFHVDTIQLADDGESVTFSVVAPPGAGEDMDVFFTGPQGWRFGTPEADPGEDGIRTWRVAIIDGPETNSLSGNTAVILAKSGQRSIETEIIVP